MSSKCRLYIELVDDQISEFAYDARLAGLEYSLLQSLEGLFLSVSGFNDKLHVLLEKIVHEMRHLVVKKERFMVIKDAVLKRVQNWKMDDPYDHARFYSMYLLTSRVWTYDETEEALKGIILLTLSDQASKHKMS